MTALASAPAEPLLSVLRRPRPLSQWARDVVLAAAVMVVDLALFSDVLRSGLDAGVVAFAVAGFVPLVWRTVVPIPVFFAVWIHTLVIAVVFDGLRPTLGLVVALYTLSSRSSRRPSVLALCVSVPTAVAVALKNEIPQSSGQVPAVVVSLTIILSMLMTASWALGRWVGASRRRMIDLEERRLRAAAEARTEERRQIALELHDILSHSVSVMVLQADGARAVLSTDPERAGGALEHISRVGRESVGELRRLLGVLVDGSVATTADLGRRGGLQELPQLVDDARLAGLVVDLQTHGSAPAVPESLGRSVHRIVKECLANCLKHGGPGTTAVVRLVWAESVLIVEVVDDGAAGSSDPSLSTGHGLAGLRERVNALDGRLEAGPSVDGPGYTVTVTLPVPRPT